MISGRPDLADWVARRCSHAVDWPLEQLLEAKRAAGTTVACVLPALDEERTVGPIVAAIDALVVAGNITLTTGTVALAANTDGVGAEGLSQTGGTVTTTNNTLAAAVVTVNTVGGGTGDIAIDNFAVGSAAGARLTVTSNAGTGGCDERRPLTAVDVSRLRAFEQYAAEWGAQQEPPVWFEPADALVTELLDAALTQESR